MMAVVLILEPIFEADLQAQQYAGRAGCSAHDALAKVKLGYSEVVDADLSAYIDTIPHRGLKLCVARRVVDSRMLHSVRSNLDNSWMISMCGSSIGSVARLSRTRAAGFLGLVVCQR